MKDAQNMKLHHLSVNQREIFLDQILNPKLPQYNVGCYVKINGKVDLSRFSKAVHLLVSKNDAMRLVFRDVEPLVQQEVIDSADFEIKFHDMSSIGHSESQVQDLIANEVNRPFELFDQLMFRVLLVNFSESVSYFAIATHHIIMDGWSYKLLVGQLAELYSAIMQNQDSIDLSPPSYMEAINRGADYLKKKRFEDDRNYWLQRFETVPDPLLTRWYASRFQGKAAPSQVAPLTIKRTLYNRLIALADQWDVTLFPLFLSVIYHYFHHTAIATRDPDADRRFVIGLPTMNRTGRDKKVIGHFSGLTPLSLDFGDDLTYQQLTIKIAAALKADYRHQKFPISEINRMAGLGKQKGRAHLFDVSFSFEQFNVDHLFDGNSCETVSVVNSFYQHPLTIVMNDYHKQSDVVIYFYYNLAAFSEQEAQQMVDGFDHLFRQIEQVEDIPISQLPVMSSTEYARVTTGVNQTEIMHSMKGSVVDLLQHQIQHNPQRIAVIDETDRITYQELGRRVDLLSNHLKDLGVGPDVLVGLHLERSIDLVVALWSILKAGGAWLPLDPDYPQNRLALMLDDAQSPVVISSQRTESGLPASGSAHVVIIETLDLKGCDGVSELPEIDSNDLAYVLYTSGSTGRPKGVAIPHKALMNHMQWMARTFDVQASDVVFQKTPFSFDASVWEFFAPVLAGGALLMAKSGGHRDPAYLVEKILTERVTFLQVVPSLFRLLLEEERLSECDSLRHMFCGGEALPEALCIDFCNTLDAKLHNLYGPTEACIDATWHTWDGPSGETITPIGKPVDNIRAYVLDARMQPVPFGVPGELYLAGVGLAHGYWRDKSRTDAHFVTLTLGDGSTERVYKTGDLVRRIPDGHLAYLGRRDYQVKIRGIRIELGEIESALMAQPQVDQGVVVLQKSAQRLVAYYTLHSDQTVDTDVLKSTLQQRLPEHMVPSLYVALDEIPMLPNGKVNRNALPEPDLNKRVSSSYQPPGNELEKVLVEIWSDLLDVEQIGIHDNFFELGGQSLTAIEFVHRIRRALALSVSVTHLYDYPTIQALANALSTQQDQQRSLTENEADELETLVPDPKNWFEPFPLTDIQQAYLVGRGTDFELGNVSAHGYLEIDCADATFSLKAFETAWNSLFIRHDMLRAVMTKQGYQRVLPEVEPYTIALEDFSNLTPDEQQQQLMKIRGTMSHQVLDAYHWPLFEIRASKLSHGITRLHLSMDALLADAWSLFHVVKELEQLLNDPAKVLPVLNIRFRDYVLAEKAFQKTSTYQKAREYWFNRLDTMPPSPELPLADSPENIKKPIFKRHAFSLQKDNWQRLCDRAARLGLTPSGLLVSTFAEVLTLWSKSAHFTINLTQFSRLGLHDQVNALVGDFTSLTLLEVDNRTQAPFVERAKQIQKQLWQDLDHSAMGGMRVLREMTRRKSAHGPVSMPIVFTSTLGMGSSDSGMAVLNRIGDIVYTVTQTPQVWLDHQVIEEHGALVLSWDVVQGLFPDNMVETMFDAYSTLINQLADDSTYWNRSGFFDLLLADQLQQRAMVNDTKAPVSDAFLHQLFLDQAEKTPDALAVIAPDRSLSYADLKDQASRAAHWLQSHHLKPNELVGVVMEKGWQQVVAVLGIQMAGGAYLPINASQPLNRRFLILKDGQCRLALTHSLLDQASWPEDVEHLVIEETTLNALSDSVQMPATKNSDLAYVIYTSGSTGQPKGVMIDHRGAVNTILDINARYGITHQDRAIALSNLNFDLSVYDIFGMLAAGGALVMPEEAGLRDPSHWQALMVEHGVTVWNTVPALHQMLVDYLHTRNQQERPTGLRLVMMSGDWIPLDLPDRIKSVWPDVAIHSLGGATEASIWSICHPIEQVDPHWSSIPYGRPMVNQTFHIFNALMAPCPVWCPGELYIGGIGVAKGYWNNSEKTESHFVVHPRTGEPLYRTGDLGRYLPDGTIEFLGREDFQVKIHGHRIELGEIESALLEHPGIKEAVVVAVGEQRNLHALVAYLVPSIVASSGDNEALDPDELEGVILDPAERAAFKLDLPGIRFKTQQSTELQLQAPAQDADLTNRYIQRQSYREFRQTEIENRDFGHFISCLKGLPLEGAPLPKYRYASAGSLYPVQCYIHVKPGRIAGVDGGLYYYHPQRHSLVLMDAVEDIGNTVFQANQAIFQQSAFSLFLLGYQDAITPMYANWSRDFSLLEAGYISQLLMEESVRFEIGLCPIGTLEFSSIEKLFTLDESHILLHAFLGGGIAPDQMSQWPQQSGGKTSSVMDEMRTHLEKFLPHYMVPDSIMILDHLPLTANGKVDRKALPEPTAKTQNRKQSDHSAASTPQEHALVGLFAEALGLDSVGLQDNFFELGGDSLSAMQMIAKVSTTLGHDIAIRDFFTNPTVAASCEAMGDAVVVDIDPVLEPEQSDIQEDSVMPKTWERAEPIRRSLLTQIITGQEPPVDSAALGYLPEGVLSNSVADRDQIIDHLFEGMPMLGRILETPDGRIGYILLPRFSHEIYQNPDQLMDEIVAALSLAKQIGAGCVALTGLIPSATNYGLDIEKAVASRPDLPPVTTGHATTIPSVVLTLKKSLRLGGRNLADEKVAFLGLGSIGSGTCRLMLDVLAHPKSLMLCDVAGKQTFLKQLADEVRDQYGFEGDISLLEGQSQAPDAIYEATVIIGATSVTDVLDVARLKPGTIIVDDSAPHCFAKDKAIERFKNQSDLLFTEGGAVRLAGDIRYRTYMSHRLEQDLGAENAEMFLRFNPSEIMGCTYSGLLSVRHPELKPTLGDIQPHLAKSHFTYMQQLNVDAADLHCEDFPLSKSGIERFNKMFSKEDHSS
ncbi:MAG: amino acid adenylation domain-containing protein [Magnetococcales bacterium]|nr:amino acid adenylation domain-containing protein [Magnetococcales bacterium]